MTHDPVLNKILTAIYDDINVSIPLVEDSN